MRRAQIIARLRRVARKRGLHLTVEESRGKGSHSTVTPGGRCTIVISGELKPNYVKLLLKQSGLPPGAL